MDNMEGPLPPGKQAPPNWYDTLDRHHSVPFSAKGLRNAPGENNCFLNSAVQDKPLKQQLIKNLLNLSFVDQDLAHQIREITVMVKTIFYSKRI